MILTLNSPATVPPHLEYVLTPLRHTLKDLLYTIKNWLETNIEAVLKAQKQYDKPSTN